MGTALAGQGWKEATREKLGRRRGGDRVEPTLDRTEATVDEPDPAAFTASLISVRPASPTTGRGSSRGWPAPGDSRGLETATAGSMRPAALTGPNALWTARGQAAGRVAGGAETRAPAAGHVGRGWGSARAQSGGGTRGRTRAAVVRFYWDLHCLVCCKHSLPVAFVRNSSSSFSICLSFYFSFG